MRYPKYSKSAIAFGLLAAFLWSAGLALLIGQVSDQALRPFAITDVIIAATFTIVLVLDRVAARLDGRATRPPIIVHPAWTPDVASKTTVTNRPRAVSIPVPVLHVSGSSMDGETTLSIRRRGGTATMEPTPTTGDPAYDRAFTDIANGVFGDVAEDDE